MVNSWKAKNKQGDKIHILIRVSKVTVFDLYFDVSKREGRLMVLNFGFTW